MLCVEQTEIKSNQKFLSLLKLTNQAKSFVQKSSKHPLKSAELCLFGRLCADIALSPKSFSDVSMVLPSVLSLFFEMSFSSKDC